jgi:hypothetical protein
MEIDKPKATETESSKPNKPISKPKIKPSKIKPSKIKKL